MNLGNKLGKEAICKGVQTLHLCQQTGKAELCVPREHLETLKPRD